MCRIFGITTVLDKNNSILSHESGMSDRIILLMISTTTPRAEQVTLQEVSNNTRTCVEDMCICCFVQVNWGTTLTLILPL